jgi:hypothetical protein
MGPGAHRLFLAQALLFEAVLVVLAWGLAGYVGLTPLADLHPSGTAFLMSVAATVPLLAAFVVLYLRPITALQPIKSLLERILGPYLRGCGVGELLLLSAWVGFCEELLFRGVLQPWFAREIGVVAALLASNLLFGLAHAITPAYGIIAGTVGIYLGGSLYLLGAPALFIPVVIHALYDFGAFLILRSDYRRRDG